MWPFRKNRRALFAFHDGQRQRQADPLAVSHALCCDLEFAIDKHPALADAGNVEATQIMLRGLRRAFGVNPWTEDQPGLTEAETLELFVTFCEYLEALKKNTSTPLTSPSATEPAPLEQSATSVASGSRSTLAGPVVAAPSRQWPPLGQLSPTT